MPTVKMRHLCAALVVSAIGLVVFLSSPANAERVNKNQGSYQSQRVAANTNARRAKAREVREPNAVYWGCCTRWVPTPTRLSARRFCAMRAASSGGLTRRARLTAGGCGCQGLLRWASGGSGQKAGCIAPKGANARKTAAARLCGGTVLEREGVQDQRTGDQSTQDEPE
jgi:hypothetical protein